MDIAPTLADIAGIPAPESWMGESVLALVKSPEVALSTGRTRYARNARARSITTDDWHYIVQRREPTERLHRNDGTDFFGQVNVLSDHADVAEPFSEDLDTYWERTRDTKKVVRSLMKDLEGTVSEDLPDDIREQLETLGYLE
jgi:arylsulfatase A-like enzyme